MFSILSATVYSLISLGKSTKLSSFLNYFDLARCTSGDDKSPVYRFYAIIVHSNVMNTSSGHYVCYAKDRHSMWYEIDDSKVLDLVMQ